MAGSAAGFRPFVVFQGVQLNADRFRLLFQYTYSFIQSNLFILSLVLKDALTFPQKRDTLE
jgi:hypothetical protein